MNREIIYDSETRDYAMFLNGEFVGYAANYYEAERKLDRLAFERARHEARWLQADVRKAA